MSVQWQCILTLKAQYKGTILTNTKVEKGSDQNTTVLYEHVSSNDKNTTPELYINYDKNSLRWSATKVLKKRQMFFLHNNNSSNKIIIIEIIYIYIFLRRIKERFFATDQIKRKISAETGCKISYRLSGKLFRF